MGVLRNGMGGGGEVKFSLAKKCCGDPKGCSHAKGVHKKCWVVFK